MPGSCLIALTPDKKKPLGALGKRVAFVADVNVIVIVIL